MQCQARITSNALIQKNFNDRQVFLPSVTNYKTKLKIPQQNFKTIKQYTTITKTQNWHHISKNFNNYTIYSSQRTFHNRKLLETISVLTCI